MRHKPIIILPLASALGALSGSAGFADATSARVTDTPVTSQPATARSEQKPNY